MFKVIDRFEDLKDNSHPYEIGDIFPREGVKVSKARLKELSTSENKRGKPVIVLVEDENITK